MYFAIGSSIFVFPDEGVAISRSTERSSSLKMLLLRAYVITCSVAKVRIVKSNAKFVASKGSIGFTDYYLLHLISRVSFTTFLQSFVLTSK